MSLESTSEESDEQSIVDIRLQETFSGLIACGRTRARRIVGSSRSRRVFSIEEFRAQYNISDDLKIIFPKNPDDLRSTMNSSS